MTSDDESIGDVVNPEPSVLAPEPKTDVPVYVREGIHVEAFQMQILECKVDPLQEESVEVMVIPVRSGGLQGVRIKPLPPGLQVPYVFTVWKRGSGKVSIVVQNVSESPIHLKKGIQVARLVPATPVPPGMPALVSGGVTALEAMAEPLSMAEWQAKLLEKLDLSGMKNWAPRNAEVAKQLVLSYHDVFALDKNELGCTSTVEHEICIVDSEPFKERFRRIPPPLLEEVRASLRDMLDAGAIHPSQSHWCNAIMLVRKKDGTLCFCVDFRQLNARTKKDLYPLPRIQEALESMASATHFSLMDLKSGFWQVKMVPRSQPYTAFTMGNLGFYEFTRMPFGLCNVPATFQKLMQNTLGELNLTYCIIYLDDVIVFGRTEEEHLEHLRVVFECFREFNLKLKPSKCNLFQSEIIYLVHHVSKEGVRPSKDNVHLIEEFPMPETFMQVRAFCGLAGHYR